LINLQGKQGSHHLLNLDWVDFAEITHRSEIHSFMHLVNSKKNPKKGIDSLLKTAKKGDSFAQHDLALRYQTGIKDFLEPDQKEAARWFTLAANQGLVEAQCNLGIAYLFGKGVAKDYNQAAEWFRKAANKGNHVAELHMGLIYEHGYGVERDYLEAARWYKLAADQGNADALNNLARFYEIGLGVAQDPHQAAILFEKATVLNHDLI